MSKIKQFNYSAEGSTPRNSSIQVTRKQSFSWEPSAPGFVVETEMQFLAPSSARIRQVPIWSLRPSHLSAFGPLKQNHAALKPSSQWQNWCWRVVASIKMILGHLRALDTIHYTIDNWWPSVIFLQELLKGRARRQLQGKAPCGVGDLVVIYYRLVAFQILWRVEVGHCRSSSIARSS